MSEKDFVWREVAICVAEILSTLCFPLDPCNSGERLVVVVDFALTLHLLILNRQLLMYLTGIPMIFAATHLLVIIIFLFLVSTERNFESILYLVFLFEIDYTHSRFAHVRRNPATHNTRLLYGSYLVGVSWHECLAL